MTVWTDNAGRFAACDRAAEADRRLVPAVREAREIIARREPGACEQATLVLARAQRSAARILGRSA